MADKSFGVKELNLLNASGTPTITSPNNLNLNANTVAISTSVTIGQNLTVSANAGISSLNVTGIATIAQPSDSNPMANWTITNNSASAYRFTGPGQSGSDDNPDLYLVRGHRYIFKHNATTNHPIQIRVANGGAAYTDGVTYSNTGNNTTTDGNNLIINLQHDAPARLFYQCTAHGGMVGNIYTVGGPQVISGVVTATTFSGSGASLTNLPAANLTGTLPALAAPNLTNLPAANLTGTLPAISGANLTSLPSQLTLSNNANNRVITGGSGVNLNGEAGLTFDGTNFNFSRQDAGDARMYIYGGEGGDARLLLASDEGDDHIDTYEIRAQASDNALAIYQFESGSYNERLRIDNGGKIGINETSPAQQLHVHEDTIYNGILINGNAAPRIAFARSTTTTGEWSVGIDGTNGNNFAINSSNDNSNNKIIISSSQISLYGNVSVPNGNIVMGNTRGIDFSATGDAAGMTSELLDDYEEGTFTPSFNMSSGGHNMTYSVQQGSYTKIGNMVSIEIYLNVGTINANGTGSLRVGGLPFTKTGRYGGLNISYFYGLNNLEIVSALIDVNSNQIFLYKLTQGSSNYYSNTTSVAEAFTNASEIMLNGTYLAA